MKKYKVQQEIQLAKESEVANKSKQAELESWKNKYLALLEKYNQLLERTPIIIEKRELPIKNNSPENDLLKVLINLQKKVMEVFGNLMKRGKK